MEQYEFEQRDVAPTDRNGLPWMIRPVGETTWPSGTQRERRVRKGSEGLFTHPSGVPLRREPLPVPLP